MAIFNADRNYWMVRSLGGQFYEEFIANSFVAIGWDEVSDLQLIQQGTFDQILRRIELAYPNEIRKNYVANQIIYFTRNIQQGDIVITPSRNSHLITIGIVESDGIETTEPDEDALCKWQKRKNVRWLKTVKRASLEPELYMAFLSHHAVSDFSEYSSLIDRVLSKFYIKGQEAHLIIDVLAENKIPARLILSFLNNNFELLKNFYIENELDYNPDGIDMKINVQSPGIIELFGDVEQVGILLFLLSTIVGGNLRLSYQDLGIELQTDGLIEKITQFCERVRHDRPAQIIQQTAEELTIQLPLVPSEDAEGQEND